MNIAPGPTVVVVDTSEAAAEVRQALVAAGLRVVGAEGPAGMAAAAEAAGAAAAVTFDPTTAVRCSQAVQRVAPALPVITAVADDAAARALTVELTTAPGISRNTRAVALSSGVGAIVEVVVAEADSGVRLREHAALVERVREAPLVPTSTPDSTARYLAQLLHHAPVGVVAVDQSGSIQAVNPKACNLLGRRAVDAVGVPLGTLFRAGGGIDRLIELTTGTDDAVVETWVRKGRDGTDQHVEVTVAAVDPELPSLGSVALLHDVTERVRALEREAAARADAEAAAERHAALARTLQQSLLPPVPPVFPGVDLAFRYHSAGDGTSVSGDFYDAFRLPDGRYCVVLGDVSGKGVEAATLTAMARWTLRTAALQAAGLGDLFQALNRVLLDHEHGERFCTVAAVTLAISDETTAVTAATAGHPSPIVVRAGGTLEEICQAGTPAGLFEPLHIVESATKLGPGDALVMITDGVTEARAPDGRFAPTLLRDVLTKAAGWGASEIAASVESTVLGYERNVARDDVAVVAISMPNVVWTEVEPSDVPDYGESFAHRYSVEPSSVGRVRSDLAAWAHHHVEDELVDSVVLSASELATNAVRVARSVIHVEAEARGGTVTLSVSDDGVGFAPTRTARRHGDADAESGRGLLLVEALAQSVQIRCGSGLTTIRCEFATSTAGPPAG